MKIEISDELVKRANKILSDGYDWDGTPEDWKELVEELIEDYLKEF